LCWIIKKEKHNIEFNEMYEEDEDEDGDEGEDSDLGSDGEDERMTDSVSKNVRKMGIRDD